MHTVRKLSAIILAIPILLIAPFASAEELEVEVTIQSVDLESRTMTVELEETGDLVTYRVDPRTNIDIYGNIGGDLDELHSGQQVTLRFDDEELYDNWVILHMITVI